MNETEKFKAETAANIASAGNDEDVKALSRIWVREIARHKYAYNFRWMGRPIIQFPQDIVAMQELVWEVRPDLIIETGIAHGGSLVMNASLLALLDYCDALDAGIALDARTTQRRVLGIDVDIRAHNRTAIESHPLARLIDMIEGSSIDPRIVERVREIASGHKRVLVCLDSNHTHDHVLAELEAYAPLVSTNSYCVVFDTLIELMPEEAVTDRPWGKGNNPMTAVRSYLQKLHAVSTDPAGSPPLRFELDSNIDNKLLISAAPGGYMKRIS